MTDVMNIGTQIKEKRLALNLRMNEVAEKASITRSTLWSMEKGDGNYSISSLLKVLNVLNLSIAVNNVSSESNKRIRATRANTILDKKVNRFVIMCVEQYAQETNQSSEKVYTQMKSKKIIDELVDDYEDLHGMSTIWLNDYIDKLLDK